MRSLFEIQTQVLNIYLKNFPRFLRILALSLLWNIIINSVPVSIAMVTRFIIPVASVSLLIALLTALGLTEGFAELMNGRDLLPAAVLGKALRRFLPFLPVFFIWLLIITVGAFFFFIPGIVFAVWLIFLVPIFMREHSSPLAIFRRSKALGDGHFFRILIDVVTVALVIFFVVIMAGQGLLNIVKLLPYFAIAARAYIIAGVFSAVILTILTPLMTGTIVALYYDLRKLKGI